MISASPGLVVLAWLIAADTSSPLGPFLPFISVAGVAALVGAYIKLRGLPSALAKTEAEAEHVEELARKTKLETEEIARNILSETLREMREEVLRERAKTAESEAAAARFALEVKTLEAQSARQLASASEARHDLANKLMIRDGRISELEREVRQLRDEISVLRASLDPSQHGRRDDDQSMSKDEEDRPSQ